MSEINSHIDDLLVKYLVGEATEAESREVQQWLAQSEDNKKYFEHFKLIWDQSRHIAAKSEVNEDAAWLRLQSRINRPAQQPVTEPVVRRLSVGRWLSIAAAVLVVCVAGYLAFNKFSKVQMVNLQSNNQVITDTLPDGSMITLNANSTFNYPEEFDGNTRKVSLTGEAFFKVAPDKTKPFIITVNDVTVRVVGTSFNIKSRKGKTEVIVETGIVKVSHNQESVELRKGERTIAERGTVLQKQQSKNRFYNYYRTKELVCDQIPLSELVPVLNDIYNSDVVISNPKLKTEKLTTTFKDQTLDQVLLVISETFNIKVEHSGSQILLK